MYETKDGQATHLAPSARGRVLQVGPLLPSLEKTLREQYEVERLPRDAGKEKFLTEHGPSFAAVVTTARVGVDVDLLRALPGIGAIIHFGVGYDSTDVVAAHARGVVVSNTPDVLTECVADLAVGALIDIMRRLSAADRFVRRGEWQQGAFPLTARVHGKRVGILGLGRIGRAVARRLQGFDMEVLYHNRHEVEGVDYSYVDSPKSLASACDALVVTTAGGEGTRGLVSASVLEALGPRGYLVNVSRGTVIDQQALVEAVLRGKIAGAALDVFVDEPNVPSELLDRDDVLLLPHIASATHETRQAMAQLVLSNLDQFMSDGTLVTPVPRQGA